MSFTDFFGGTIRERVENGHNGREMGNTGVCLDVTFGVCCACEGCDSGEDTTGRDMANVRVAKIRRWNQRRCEQKSRKVDKLIGVQERRMGR